MTRGEVSLRTLESWYATRAPSRETRFVNVYFLGLDASRDNPWKKKIKGKRTTLPIPAWYSMKPGARHSSFSWTLLFSFTGSRDRFMMSDKCPDKRRSECSKTAPTSQPNFAHQVGRNDVTRQPRKGNSHVATGCDLKQKKSPQFTVRAIYCDWVTGDGEYLLWLG